MSAGNLLINGAFLSNLWTRLEGETIPCPPELRTFAADCWGVRYAHAETREVCMARSAEAPGEGETSLELRGADGVAADVLVGQFIGADEALHYRRELRCSIWIWVSHPTVQNCPIRLLIGSASEQDIFDDSVAAFFESETRSVPVNAWTRLDFGFDAKAASRHGIRVEWHLSAAFFNHPKARVRMSAASLSEGSFPRREQALETMLARRFCQRHSAQTVNAIGRALVCNAHELHFQFTFPEMRAPPVITLPQDNENLGVFSLDGIPQTSFTYDVTHAARGSVIIRATKWNHELQDGYLAFRGYRGSILLEAEL